MSALDAGIVEWVNTFEISSPCSALWELSDGVTLSEVLLEISPGLFDADTIKRSAGDNWALKLTNLRKLLGHVETFYRESLERDSDFSRVDLSGVARSASPAGIRTLVQLLVGAAVSCDSKADYIQAIMLMSEEGQKAMQQMVQEAMAGMPAYADRRSTDGEGVARKATLEEDDDRREAMGEGAEGSRGAREVGSGALGLARSVSTEQSEEEWAQRLAEAEESMAALAKARDKEAFSRRELEKELTVLRERMLEVESQAIVRSARDEEASSMSASLQHALSNVDDKELRLQQAVQETRVLESKLDQEAKTRSEKEFELRQLEDELDIAKAKAAQLTKMEASLEKYKRRLEEMEDLRQQNKELDDLNTKYLDQMLKLESTAKTIPNLNKKIEQYKDQAVEFERQNFEAKSAVVVKDTEVQRLREDLESATQAKMFFEDELIALRDQNKAHAEALEEDPSMAGQGGLFAGATNRAELREQVARQEQEIALLKARIADGGGEDREGASRVEVLESQLEHARRVKDERSAEALSAKRNAADLEQKNHKLEQLLAELKGAPQSAAQAEKSSVKIQELKDEMARLRGLAGDRERLRMTVQSLEDRLKERETQVNNLQTDKEKLESYTKETLHTFQDKYMVAISHCKAQLAEKNEKIDYLEGKIARDKVTSKREERLLMSTVYELGMDLIERQLKSSVTDKIREAEASPGSSWMQRQRSQVKKTSPLAAP